MKVEGAALDLKRDAIAQCRAEIREITKRIRQSGDVDAQAEAQKILPDGRIANIRKLPNLEAIRDALAAIQVVIEDEQNEQSRNAKTSGASEAIATPESQSTFPSKICGSDAANAIGRLTPATAYSAASWGYQLLVDALGGPTWYNLVEASSRRLAELGITQATWGRACRTLGRERAALCVLVIDRNWQLPEGHKYRPEEPGKCLSGMIRGAAIHSGLLPRMLHAARSRQIETVTSPPAKSITTEPSPMRGLMTSALANIQITDEEPLR